MFDGDLKLPTQEAVDNFNYTEVNRWYLHGELLPHTEQEIEALQSGDYQVIARFNICDSEPSPMFAFTVTALEDFEIEMGLKVFLNPSVSSLQISMNQVRGQLIELSIINLQGQKVFEEVYQGGEKFKQEISTELLENGIYFLKIKNEEGFIIKKIIVQKP